MSKVMNGFAACVAGVGIAVGAGLAGASFKRASSPPAAPVIAVIDLEATFNGLTERTDLEAQLKSRRENMQTELDKLAAEAKDAVTQVEPMPAGPAKTAKAKEAQEKMIRAEFEGQFSQKKLDALRGEMRRELYNKIVDTASRLSKQNGYSMVMASDEKAVIPPADPETVARAIGLKRMLWVDDSMEITAEVIAMMNNEYAAGGKTAPVKR